MTQIYKARNPDLGMRGLGMSLNTNWNSHSMDFRLFGFTKEDEDILINAPGGGKGDSQSRSSTLESHKNCHG